MYNYAESLKELGLPLYQEALDAVSTLEEDLIKNEIIPRLAENIEPLITKIRRPIVFVVDYLPNENLSVRLTRKKVITDDNDTKLYPISTESLKDDKIYRLSAKESGKKKPTEKLFLHQNQRKRF